MGMHARWIVATIAALGSIAHGDPAPGRLGFGAANMRVAIERATISVNRGVATLTLWFGSESRGRDEGEAAIDVPHGARIVALVLRSGGTAHVGGFVPVEQARTRYREILERKYDPAILEWASTEKDQDRYRLRVFPVGRYRSASVEIQIE